VLDIRRLVEHRRHLDLNASRLLARSAALVLSAIAVGWGAVRWTRGQPAPQF
jgi:hypothetical protein